MKKKKRMGPVSSAALKGDLIAIFQGADVPFFLRRTNAGEYVLIKDCCIHGISNMEILQGKNAQARDILYNENTRAGVMSGDLIRAK